MTPAQKLTLVRSKSRSLRAREDTICTPNSLALRKTKRSERVNRGETGD
jgi:hypothetical protein